MSYRVSSDKKLQKEMFFDILALNCPVDELAKSPGFDPGGDITLLKVRLLPGQHRIKNKE